MTKSWCGRILAVLTALGIAVVASGYVPADPWPPLYLPPL